LQWLAVLSRRAYRQTALNRTELKQCFSPSCREAEEAEAEAAEASEEAAEAEAEEAEAEEECFSSGHESRGLSYLGAVRSHELVSCD
tara:strand:- start:2049 stop:2309 length:261 start_codon:yes stop_codon:yes gene_type:complete